jgi:HD superfamily phosphohydrolase
LKIYDRLYGELKFPSIILDLLSCPGLLRLRDVRMANNQFVAFPAFASASRYEHSLGVCYLAGLCAKSLRLPEKESIELMMACLYHDVGTPPFAHAMEEVLQAEFGFDHEQNLKNLIMGTTGEFDGDMARIFQDEGLKLRSVCHSKKGRAFGLDLYRIAKIAAGDKDELLSPLLNSNEMDLDNIDNIVRASSAMGLIQLEDIKLASRLAHAFIFENKQIFYDGNYINDIRKWQQIRDIQYTAIFDSVDDFSYQTMIKKALHLLMKDNNASPRIDRNSWKLTDSSIVHDYLLNNPKSHEIMRRVLLCKPFHCLGILYVQGNGVSKYINLNLDEIEHIASDYFIKTLDVKQKKLDSVYTNAVVANFYPDKRKRRLQSKAISWSMETVIDEVADIPEGSLLGLFTPFTNSNHKEVAEIDGGTARKSVSFRGDNLNKLIQILTDSTLKGFGVSVYGSDSDGRPDTNATGYQLELF